MDNFLKPRSHSPNYNNGFRPPYYMTPHGLLLPRAQQPPPMFGPRGSTVPPKFLNRPFNQNKKFKQKDQSTWCETCDRGFGSKDELDTHLSEHQKCGIDGCQFVGHPLVVTKHIQMQHSSGLFEKFKNLDTPEDIEKWRAERKKKFPTTKNVELRQKAQEERVKRGERINEPKNRFGRHDRRNFKNNFTVKPINSRDKNNFKSKPYNRYNNKNSHNEINPEAANKTISEVTEISKTITTDDKGSDDLGNNTFKGTSKLKDYKRLEKENPLKNLLEMYGSDSDTVSDNEEIKTTFIELKNSSTVDSIREIKCVASVTTKDSDKVINHIENTVKLLTQNITEEGELTSDNDDMPESIPIVRNSEIPEAVNVSTGESLQNVTEQCDNKEKRNRSRQRKRKGNTNKSEPITKAPCTSNVIAREKILINYKNLRKSNQNTLLEKLLQEQIRRERNIILQCVRYVVENNFFLSPSTK